MIYNSLVELFEFNERLIIQIMAIFQVIIGFVGPGVSKIWQFHHFGLILHEL